MASSATKSLSRCILLSVQHQGYKPVYKLNSVNPCPGCGRTHWLVGRSTAECAFCATALPIEESYVGQSATITRIDRHKGSANHRGAFTINGRS